MSDPDTETTTDDGRSQVGRRTVLKAGGTALCLFGTTTAAARVLDDGSEFASSRVLDGDDNPWLSRRVLNFAHQGGAREAPSDTLFALKTAKQKGADVLEVDVHATVDGETVAIHDETVDRTTNGSGPVEKQTLAELKQLDAAYWFLPGCGACHDYPPDEHPLRGYATGDREIPEDLHRRYGLSEPLEPNDFSIPTLRGILELFPDTFLTIEIKRTFPDTEPYEKDVARLLAEYNRTGDVIVVSFHDLAMEAFKLYAPAVHTALPVGESAVFIASSNGPLPGTPHPRYQAIQVPIERTGITIVTEDFVRDAHANDLAVHVWTINEPSVMQWLIDIGVDGIMTDVPTVLEEVLASEGIRYDQ